MNSLKWSIIVTKKKAAMKNAAWDPEAAGTLQQGLRG